MSRTVPSISICLLLFFFSLPIQASRYNGLRHSADPGYTQTDLMNAAGALYSDINFLTSLNNDGYARLPNAVPKHLVERALGEVNRMLAVTKNIDFFKGYLFPNTTQLTDVFNESFLPFLMRKLFGEFNNCTLIPRATQDTCPSAKEYHQNTVQLAIRFPGDGCPDQICDKDYYAKDHEKWEWHIDGISNKFVGHTSLHFDTIENYDALVGVLLSDIPEVLSGELSVYPKSHRYLADYFSKFGFDEVAKTGTAALPRGYGHTEKVLKTPPVPLLGKAGDAYIFSYNTAHFVNINQSPYIRYALYFRVVGPKLAAKPFADTAHIFNPTQNWNFAPNSHLHQEV